jgi:hypothetical protein
VRIESYEFGSITVDGETYTSDVIISPEGVNTSWWRVKGHELCCADLEPIWQAKPDILIIGTGAYGVMRVLPEADELMRKRCAQVHVLPTTEAWERFNELSQQEKGRVVAALHLTC